MTHFRFRKQTLQSLLLGSVAVLAIGCVSNNTHRDQLQSLAKYDQAGINAKVYLPELKGKKINNLPAADFLTLHSGMLVSGDYVNSAEFQKQLHTVREADDDALTLGFSVPIAKGGSGFGSAAPITSDGYFLTAAHVLSHDDTFVLYAATRSGRTQIVSAKVRTVYRNDMSDFAIVKANISTPRYLRFRYDTPAPGTVMFAGGWMHEKAGGQFLQTLAIQDSSGKPTSFKKVVTSIPMIKGDSGSPLIDQNGKLCGVLSTMRLGVIVKAKPLSTAVMINTSQINSIISRDRRR
ncbi:MAG: serine protease [Verrucomicrobiota bacterium]